MNVGRMIFYDNLTGEKIVDTGQWKDVSRKKTVDQQIATYKELSERNRDTFDVIVLEYGQYAQDFAEGRLIGVDLETKNPIFEYPNTENPTESIITDKPLSVEITELKSQLMNADEKYKLLDKGNISLGDLKKAKIEQLKYLCEQSIYNGFISTVIKDDIALEFGFNIHDQNNFTQQTLLIVSANGNYTSPINWKTKNVGIVELTVSEFNIIINDATNHKVGQQNKYWQLESQVNNATDITTVDSIIW